ncbi:class D sortase [Mycoplasma sp. P36-A1]|uniref:class D sortase n=1 Tax=Mycoplasma sp. P36-A1 TaxID=3252900 RepID=UPI003C2E0E28
MRNKNKKKSPINTLLNIIIILCLAGAAYFAGKYFYDIYQQKQNASVALVKANKTLKTKEDVRKKKKIDIGTVLGVFKVDGLIDETPIIEGDNLYEAMAHGIGHVQTTRLPGTGNGIIALSAHRETFFKPLKDMKIGDIITVKMPYGTYKYEVKKSMIVNPDQGALVYSEENVNTERLALITCYPFSAFSTPSQRIIFFADLIE